MMKACIPQGEGVLRIFFLLLFGCFLLVLAGEAAAEATVSATLSPSSFSIGQSGQLSLTVTGTKSAELELPEVEGLEILRRGQSSRMNFVNGTYSSSLTTTFIVIASAPGQYIIPPIRVTVGKKHFETEPLELSVTPAAATVPSAGTDAQHSANKEGPNAFITLEGIGDQHYLGEVVPVTIRAYFHQGLRADLASFPRLTGDSCVIEPLKKEPAQIRETKNGAGYNVLIWETELSPIKEGDHTLQLEMDAVQYVQQRRQSTSIFGGQSPFGRDIFDDFFGGVQKRPFRLASEPLPITILPLPAEGRPDDFNGAVGIFSFETSVEPQSAEVGEPLTLQLKIRGSGNLDRVEAPLFPDSPAWKSYTPSLLETSASAQRTDEKIFEQAVVAKSRDVEAIPPIFFSYFDPAKKSYVTLTSQPLPVTISGDDAPLPAAAAVVAAPGPTSARPDDLEGLAPLHLDPGGTVSTIRPLFLQSWFLLLLAALLLVLAGSLAMLYYQCRSQNRQEEKLHIRQKNLHKSLQLMEKAAQHDDSAAFLRESRRCIQHYFGSLWDCEPSAITLSDISRKTHDSTQLAELFKMSEQAAYGGKMLDKTAMVSYLQLFKSELEGSA